VEEMVEVNLVVRHTLAHTTVALFRKEEGRIFFRRKTLGRNQRRKQQDFSLIGGEK